MFHKDLTLGDRHQIHNWEYATSVERLAAVGFVEADLKKVSLQTSDNTFWLLTSTTPTWSSVSSASTGGGGGGPVDSVNGRTGAVTITKSDVNLALADNTSDINKVISTLQAAVNATKANQSTTYTKTETDSRIQAVVGAAPAALDTLIEIANQLATDENAVGALTTTVSQKANSASPTFTGTVAGITAAMVGLGSVNDTTDANKPVSTAQATANAAVQSAASTDATAKANAAQAAAIAASAPVSHVHSGATGAVAGFMSSADKSKLDGVQAGATAGGGMANPMTAIGDIIIGGAGGTPTKLGIGVEGQVVKIVSGVVIWGSPAAASGSIDWPNVTNKPLFGTAALVDTTTLTPIAHVGAGGTAHSAATTTVNGFMAATDKTKLDAITGTNTGDQTSVSGNAGTATALSVGADRTKLDAISGTNTGDETLSTIKTKLGITTLSGSNTGDQTTITGNAGTATSLAAGADRTKLDAITGTNTGDDTAATIRTKLGITTLSGSNTGDQTAVTGNSGSTSGLKTATTTVAIDTAVAPSVGQTLVATSPTAATWQTLSVGGGGMVNPMTTAGDTIVGGSAGAPQRLAIGTEGQVFKSVSGVVTWGINVADWANLTSKPAFGTAALVDTTTLTPIAHVGAGGTAHAAASTTVNGFMSSADKTKLDAITGTNTGDQTSVSGNAGTATALSVGADRTKLDAITGTNTGDETTATIKTKLGVTTLSGSNTGDQTSITGNSGTASALSVGADRTKLDAIAGSNTGDETLATIKSKLGVTTLSGSNTGDQTTVSGNAGSATTLAVGADRTKLDAITGTNTGDQTTITGNAGSATTLAVGTDRTKLDAITGTNTGDDTAATIRTKLGITTLSGSNTGDQTTISGNAGSATTLGVGADRTKLDAITGTNTGDDTAATIRTKLGITTLSGSNTGDQTAVSGNAGNTNALKSATTTIDVVSATAPSVGQVLTATSTTAATWQTPATGGGGSITYNETSASTLIPYAQSATAVLVDSMTLTPSAGGTFRGEASIQFSASPALVAAQCNTDLNALVTQINGLTGYVAHAAAYGAGEVLLPGRYYIAGATTHTGNLTYDAQGDPNAMWIIKCGAAHAVAAASTSTLVNGAKASNIFWLIVGAPTIGAACTLKGTYIGNSAIAPGDVFNLEGRIFTQTGAITTSNTTYTVPVGEPLVLNLGILKSFIFFTPAGAIANTVVTGGVGDVATGGGAVTGFGTIKGTVYLPTDVNSKVSFQLYQNNVPIDSTLRTTENRLYAPAESTIILGLPVITTTQAITIKVKVDVGSVTVANRSIYALKLS